MPVDPDRIKWWGWGDIDISAPTAEGLFSFLEQRIGPLRETGLKIPDIHELTIRPSFLPEKLRKKLSDLLGDSRIRMDRVSRIRRAAGRSYRDLIRIRLNRICSPPDAVVFPQNETEIALILQFCEEHGAAVIPFGGGSGVVGGLEPGPEIRPFISMDMTRMNRVKTIDPQNHIVIAEAGVFGPDLEEALNLQGYTLGHFPQSFEFSTLGGWIATRGAGHKSTVYGKIEDMILSVNAVGPRGKLHTPVVPAHAAGGDLISLLAGSEGSLGLITEAVMRIRPLPIEEWFTSFLFPDFNQGLKAVREIMVQGVGPPTIRLSDETETAALMAEAAWKRKGTARRFFHDKLVPFYLKSKGVVQEKSCLLLAVGEDMRDMNPLTIICRGFGGVKAGSGPAELWNRTRYSSPYLRDDMITRGLFVETIETAAMWDILPALGKRTCDAIEGACNDMGAPGVCLTHLSHAYREGANLYFTIIANQLKEREEEQWASIKNVAVEAIRSAGGSLSHHHGVGRDHKPWLGEYLGEASTNILKAAKNRMDPLAVLNPGVLFDPDATPEPKSKFQPFSYITRRENIKKISDATFDLLVLGGGVVGAGVAWDASLRGLSTALVEKGDFGNGASGKSSRMVHGGLRYLKMLDVKLVRESLTERHNLLRIAPHLVHPAEHIVPIYKEGDNRTFMHLGLWIYDNLAGGRGFPPHRTLSAKETLEMEPGISPEGLMGGLVYYDGLTDDARLTLETAKAAARAGAIIANYLEAVDISLGPEKATIHLRDALTNELFFARAKVAVNACGAWSDLIRSMALDETPETVRPAKGIHIAFPRKLKPISKVIILKGNDGRPLFAVPSGRMVYAGATDSPYTGDLDEVRAEAREVDYLLEAVNSFLAGPPVTRDQVCVSWAGVRPLASGKKTDETKDVSREHEILVESERLISVRGGKLTTFRLMSAQTVDKAISILEQTERPPSPTDQVALMMPAPCFSAPADMSDKTVARIKNRYGPNAGLIFELSRSPWLGAVINPDSGLITAEVYWAVFGEMALTLTDVMKRRLGLTYSTEDNGHLCTANIAKLMANLMNWSEQETSRQIEDYQHSTALDLLFKETGLEH